MSLTELTPAEELLAALGYDEDKRVREYPIWINEQRGVVQADVVAFAYEPHDMSTAVIAVEEGSPERGFEIARLLAAPYFLIAEDESVDIWLAGLEAPTLWRRGVGLSDVSHLADWLRPESAIRSKVGLRQLPLFSVPVNLLAHARAEGAERLAPIVANGLRAAGEELRPSASGTTPNARTDHRAAARLVVGALTALVLRDRDERVLHGLDPESLIMQVRADHPGTFGWTSSLVDREAFVLRDLIISLGSDIDYRSLDPSILSYVYEEALVDESERQALGIFYTPPRLAARLARNVPLELLPPAERYVLDPACGSGTLLVAAHDRLRGLQPTDWPPTVRHEDLAAHIRGFDVDPFAAEIARLTLFLHTQPAGNGWHIESRDTLTRPTLAEQPRIILTNPPWRYSSEGSQTQAADAFVEWSISTLAPGGFLGVLLPGSWLSARSSSEVRERLFHECEVFELWRIAQGAFPTSRSSTVALFARKNDGVAGRGARVVTEVSRRSLRPFLDGQAPSVRYLQSSSLSSVGAGPPMPELGAETVTLGSLSTVLSGQQPLRGVGDRGSGNVRYLNRLGDVGPYRLVTESALWHLNFPSDFQGARGRRIISKRKVLASAARSSEGPWRFRVAIDAIGVAMRNSMRGIAPNDQDDVDLLYAIAIIVGSAFASTFAATFAADRNIAARVLQALPIPRERWGIEALAIFGRLAATATSVSDLSAILANAEQAVWDAYGVNSQDQRWAIERFIGELAPEGTPRYPADEATSQRRTPQSLRRLGVVLDVDRPYVRLWVNGLTPADGAIVVLPSAMPGWMARPGATFDVTGVEELGDLPGGDYTFQPMAWRDPDIGSPEPMPLLTSNASNDLLR